MESPSGIWKKVDKRPLFRLFGFSFGKTLQGQWRALRPQWFIGFLQLFTYRIMIYRNKPQTVKDVCKIGYDGRYLFLLGKDNKPLPAQLNISIIDRVNQPTRAKVELFVNISEIIKIEK